MNVIQSIIQSIIQSVVLGFTEGVTEFLPVSSSGHLLIVRKLLGLPLVGSLAFDAVLQLAAAIALVIYFWRDIRYMIVTFFMMIRGRVVEEKEKILIWSIILGTVPAVVFGLALQKYLDNTFRNVKLVALALMAGSALMYFAQKYGQRYAQKVAENVAEKNDKLTVGKGVLVGFFQSLAIIPGISRSGATISGGLFSGLSRESAVRFSFLLSVPVLVGSGLKELWSVRHMFGATAGVATTNSFGISLLAGSITSFIVAFFAIHYMLRFLKNHNLTIFIWYRVLLALLILLVF